MFKVNFREIRAKPQELYTYHYDNVDNNLAKEILVSKYIGEQFGIEFYLDKYGGKKYFITTKKRMNSLTSVEMRRLILGLPQYQLTCGHLSGSRAFCFPFSFAQTESIWETISKALSVVDEKVFIQVLCKKKSEQYKNDLKQMYDDYLKGIYTPVKSAIIRSVQYKMLDLMKRLDEDFGGNTPIDEVTYKLEEDGFDVEIRYCIYGEDERRRTLVKKLKSTFATLDLENSWIMSEEKKKDSFLESLQLRKMSAVSNEIILSTSELLPFFFTKSKQPEKVIEPIVATEVVEESSSSPVLDNSPFAKLPKEKRKKNDVVDVKLADKFNKTIHKLNLLPSTINVVVQSIQNGATLQRMTFNLPKGLKLTQLKSAAEDIQAELGIKGISFDQANEAGTVTMFIPLEERNIVYLGDCAETDDFMQFAKDAELPFILGVDSLGNPIFEDLARIKHLLMAGTTGSGKSFALTMLILMLSIMRSPKELNFVMIDPKMVELSPFENYPHVLDVVTDMSKATAALIWVIKKMEQRYQMFKAKGYKNIKQYNKNEPERIPYIVVVVDELADLLAVNKDVEDYLERIAQLGRAAGIDLIIATQYPITDVVTPLIKRNIISRICFALDSGAAYRVVLDHSPGYQLLGKGDGIYTFEGIQGMHRFQGAVISVDENEQDQKIKYYESYWKGKYRIEKIDYDDVEEVDKDYEKLKYIIADRGETRMTELRRLLKIRNERLKDYMVDLVSEGWLEAPQTRNGGYKLMLTTEQRREYINKQ